MRLWTLILLASTLALGCGDGGEDKTEDGDWSEDPWGSSDDNVGGSTGETTGGGTTGGGTTEGGPVKRGAGRA